MQFNKRLSQGYSSQLKREYEKENIKEIQNKTQPLPKTLLDIAKAEAINLSTGTSITGQIG